MAMYVAYRTSSTEVRYQICDNQAIIIRHRIYEFMYLGELFREVASIYEPMPCGSEWEAEIAHRVGEYISDLLQQDWEIFSPEIADKIDLQETIAAILQAGLDPKEMVDFPDYEGFFEQKRPWDEEEIHKWIRKLLTKDGSTDENEHSFGLALEDLAKDYPEGHIFYRARIHEDRSRINRFTPGDLGAPPPEEVRAARANSKGKPVLYLASDRETALAEVRAWRGMEVAVAKVRLKRNLRVVDLLKFVRPESPFFVEDLEWRVGLADLYQIFADDLSRPVLPNEEEELYQFSQDLCEFMQTEEWDGVAYPSAAAVSGFNVVLFSPDNDEPFDVQYVHVDGVEYHFRDMNENEPLYCEDYGF
ncbi:MAG: RES family NAD+ phosphorylase [bacterium]